LKTVNNNQKFKTLHQFNTEHNLEFDLEDRLNENKTNLENELGKYNYEYNNTDIYNLPHSKEEIYKDFFY
jgi:hypothetical protein